ncbi:MAG: hypothetical protein H8E32_03110 [Nitrospinae bacterium]|nr:hypothetical protein [Nitrospinota bacterium]
MRSSIVALIIFLIGFTSPVLADSGYDYQLYKNHENYGIVVFPKSRIFKDLDSYLISLPFEAADSGKAVMRHGSKNENATYMMPLDVQKKHSIEKFIVIQVLGDKSMLVGVYDPEWGLTLPSTIFQMETIKKNIPKTLNVFRGSNDRQRQTWLRQEKMPVNLNFPSKSEYNIILADK